MRETYTFQDFLASVDGETQTFVSELHDELTALGCSIDMKSAKSGYVVSYSLNKKTVANYVFRKKGLIARIYAGHIAQYKELLDTLPDGMVCSIQEAPICKHLVDPAACNQKCSMGYDFILKGERLQRCRNHAFMFLLNEESRPYVKSLLLRQVKAAVQGQGKRRSPGNRRMRAYQCGGFMKIKITLILSLLLLLCSCAENADQGAGADHTYLPDSSMPETPVTGQLPETDADVPGTGKFEALDPGLLAEETDGEPYYGTDPWLNDPDNPESEKWRHSFMTTAFSKNGYAIKLAWNNPPSLYETTRQVIAEREYTVSFIEETKGYADDPQVLEAIRLCILDRKQEEAEADGGPPEEAFLLTDPVVVDVDGPHEDADQ